MFKLSFLCEQNVSPCLLYFTKLYKSCVLSHSIVLFSLNKVRIKTDIVTNPPPPHQRRIVIGLHANFVYLCVDFVEGCSEDNCLCQSWFPTFCICPWEGTSDPRNSVYSEMWFDLGNFDLEIELVLCWRSSETCTAGIMYKMYVGASIRGMAKKASAQQNTMTLKETNT